MNQNENNNFNLNPIIANIEMVKAMKAGKSKKKPSTSIKPLKFDPSPEDSPLKAEIIRQINMRNLTYSDIYNYCTALKGGDIAEGQKLGYNIISGLKTRHTMIDTTFSRLCDFLNLDITLVERQPIEKTDEEDDE